MSQLLRSGWFIGCLVILTVFTVGFEIRFRGSIIRKDPLPLKKNLSLLDRKKLFYMDPKTGKACTYESAGAPTQLPPDMVDQLGTDQYLGWTLRLRDGATRTWADPPFQVFITYYTGNPDQVPHVPEQCMLGNGFHEAGSQLVKVQLPGLAARDREVPVQALTFRRSTQMGDESRLVMYTFRVSDEWHADRNDVRLALGNPLARYAYFSKVEVSFQLPPELPADAVPRATEAGRRFLEIALPILVQEHWPDWPTNGPEAPPKATAHKSGS